VRRKALRPRYKRRRLFSDLRDAHPLSLLLFGVWTSRPLDASRNLLLRESGSARFDRCPNLGSQRAPSGTVGVSQGNRSLKFVEPFLGHRANGSVPMLVEAIPRRQVFRKEACLPAALTDASEVARGCTMAPIVAGRDSTIRCSFGSAARLLSSSCVSFRSRSRRPSTIFPNVAREFGRTRQASRNGPKVLEQIQLLYPSPADVPRVGSIQFFARGRLPPKQVR
jgi:hypothetical protein